MIQRTPSEDIKRIFQLQSAHANLMRLRATTASERLRKVRAVKSYLLCKENIEMLCKALHADLRKSHSETEANELAPVLLVIKHIEDNLRKWVSDRKVETPLAMSGLSSHVRYESKGAVLVIAPWNYPFQLVLVPFLHAMVAGNAVMVKPSEYVPATSAFLESMFKELFDESEVAFAFGEADVAQEVLSLPFHHIFFTGSPSVGKLVMQAAAQNLTSVTLELGGKSPVIVHDSYDIRTAAKKIAWAKTMNCGQTCIAPDYVLLPEGSEKHFADAFAKAVAEFYNPDGKGVSSSSDYSRIINRKNLLRLKNLMEQDLEVGAHLLYGGAMDEDDLFIEPTLLGNMKPYMGLMQQEIFGPILPVCTYKRIDDALHTINSMERPLALYILSNDRKATRHVLSNTTSGGVGINELMVTSVNPALPFGGVNHSGIGRSNGLAGFISFSNERGVVRRSWGTFAPIYPPYKPWLISLLRKLTGF
ncbi:MAG: aldehyde dehydrogenase family protein [Bacteroidota bacterium]|jgi:aldehyde dehydrogenase (NAD+)